MRLIDADALIDELGISDEDIIFEGMLVDAPTIDAVPRWIPCEERLPSEEGAYIVYAPTYRGGSSTAKENHGGIMFSKWKNSKWSIEHGYYERPNCVLAWMPLPEPYEGERKDDE